MASNPVSKLSEEQYLAIERAAEYKSEFLDGVMYAMSVGSLQHSALQRNIIFQLHAKLQASGCQVYTSDLRVQVSGSMYAYPDISVVCGKPMLADSYKDVLLNPIVIIEVLSPSTEKYDRGERLHLYQTVESLQEYILVNQDKIMVEQYVRGDANTWIVHYLHNPDDELKMDSINAALPLRRIYDGVDFAA